MSRFHTSGALEYRWPNTLNKAKKMGSSREVHLVQLSVVAVFFVIGNLWLGTPQEFVFDERYYIGAGINFAEMSAYVNREHPNLAKLILAFGWLVMANNLTWLRFIALLAGTLGLYWCGRALWWRTQNAFASMVFPFLLLSGILLLSLSRMAVLEPFVFGFGALSVFLFVRQNYLASGATIGMAVACKWTIAPVAVFLVVALFKSEPRKAVLFSTAAAFAYIATFIPAAFVQQAPLHPQDLPFLHLAMLERLSLFVRGHPYQSEWWEWLYGGGAVYFGSASVPMMVNVALAAPSVIALLRFRDRGISAMGIACLALVALSGKPVLLIHQFLLVHVFALAALSIELDHIRRPLTYSWLAICGIVAVFTVVFWRPDQPTITDKITVSEQRLDAMHEAVECLEYPRQCYLGE